MWQRAAAELAQFAALVIVPISRAIPAPAHHVSPVTCFAHLTALAAVWRLNVKNNKDAKYYVMPPPAATAQTEAVHGAPTNTRTFSWRQEVLNRDSCTQSRDQGHTQLGGSLGLRRTSSGSPQIRRMPHHACRQDPHAQSATQRDERERGWHADGDECLGCKDGGKNQ